MAYSLSGSEFSQYMLSLLLTMVIVYFSTTFALDYDNKLRDTLANEYYDEKDKFKSV